MDWMYRIKPRVPFYCITQIPSPSTRCCPPVREEQGVLPVGGAPGVLLLRVAVPHNQRTLRAASAVHNCTSFVVKMQQPEARPDMASHGFRSTQQLRPPHASVTSPL